MSEKAQILIVEDDLDLAEMLNAYFRVQGYEVLTAAWGADAVRMSREHLPDLVVLDIRLPDIDGYEVCRQIRANRLTAQVPVIFLTEKRDRVDKLAGLELGVIDYITKPFDIQELRLRVRNALRRASQSPLINPVTNIPEGDMTSDKLETLVGNGESWAILLLEINGLDKFREAYGFVASDDVLRAMSLMINNSVREAGNENDFVGHLEAQDFIIVTTAGQVNAIRERIEIRLEQSMEYFYPLKDRDRVREAMDENRLRLGISAVYYDDSEFRSAADIKLALLRSRES